MRALLVEPSPSYAQVSASLEIPIGSIGPIRAKCLDRMRGHDTLRAFLYPDL